MTDRVGNERVAETVDRRGELDGDGGNRPHAVGDRLAREGHGELVGDQPLVESDHLVAHHAEEHRFLRQTLRAGATPFRTDVISVLW